MRLSSILLFAAVLAGCAAPTTQRVAVTQQQTDSEVQKQTEIYIEEYVGELQRLRKVHWEVATKAVAQCPKKAAVLGAEIRMRTKGDVGAALERLYGVTTEPTVLFVIEGSPAQLAGMQPRDRVLSVSGIAAKDTKAIAEKLRTWPADKAVPVVVQRGGQTLKVSVQPVVACDYPAALDENQVVNAYADGERILVTRGMVSFARTDEELALVISHEMAHNAMSHIDAKRTNAAGGLVADIALAVLTRGAYSSSAISQMASEAYSQDYEAEADYVGLYMMASTSYSIENAPKFWRRMAAANPASIAGSMSATHPSTSYRMVALEKTVTEIDTKRTTGVALLPEKKAGKDGVQWGQPPARQDQATCFQGTDGKCSR